MELHNKLFWYFIIKSTINQETLVNGYYEIIKDDVKDKSEHISSINV